MNFVRLVSVRVAPMDLNLDMALMDALLQLSTRIEDLLDVSRLDDRAGVRRGGDDDIVSPND